MIVNVSKRIISIALRNNPDDCPVALAMRETTGQTVTVGEDLYTIWDGPEKLVRVKIGRLPAKVKSFIAKFDNGLSVKPITFEV